MRMKPGCPFANNIVSETSTGATQTYLESVFHENHVSEVLLFLGALQTLQKWGFRHSHDPSKQNPKTRITFILIL